MSSVYNQMYYRVRNRHPDWSRSQIAAVSKSILEKNAEKRGETPPVDELEFEQVLGSV